MAALLMNWKPEAKKQGSRAAAGVDLVADR